MWQRTMVTCHQKSLSSLSFPFEGKHDEESTTNEYTKYIWLLSNRVYISAARAKRKLFFIFHVRQATSHDNRLPTTSIQQSLALQFNSSSFLIFLEKVRPHSLARWDQSRISGIGDRLETDSAKPFHKIENGLENGAPHDLIGKVSSLFYSSIELIKQKLCQSARPFNLCSFLVYSMILFAGYRAHRRMAKWTCGVVPATSKWSRFAMA